MRNLAKKFRLVGDANNTTSNADEGGKAGSEEQELSDG